MMKSTGTKTIHNTMKSVKKWDTAQHLRNSAEIDAYLKASFVENDEKQIIRALDNAVRAQEMLGIA